MRTYLVRSLRALWTVLLLCNQVGCGTSTALPSSVGSDSAGTVIDRTGDTIRDPLIEFPPDLKTATVEIYDDAVTVTVSFARGTLSRTDTSIAILLDTDEDPLTGYQIRDRPSGDSTEIVLDSSLGWEYSVDGPAPIGSTSARVSRWRAPDPVGAATVAFTSDDEVRFSVPLDLLGNDDGHMRFRVHVSQVQPTPPFIGTDYVPDPDQPPGRASVVATPSAARDAGR